VDASPILTRSVFWKPQSIDFDEATPEMGNQSGQERHKQAERRRIF
jgi:hypothetical protein